MKKIKMKHKSTYRAIVLGLAVVATVGIGVFSGVREAWAGAVYIKTKKGDDEL